MANQRGTRAPRMLPYTGFVAAGLCPLLANVSSQSDGWDRAAWAIAAGISAFYAAFCGYRVQLRLKRAAETIKDTSILDKKFGAVAPMLVQFVQEICLAKDVHTCGKTMGQLREFAIASARELGGSDTRVAVYRFKPHDGHKEMDCLERDGHRGGAERRRGRRGSARR